MGITHGDFSTCPANAFNGRLAGFRAVWLPYPHPCPENVTTGRETSPRGGGGLPGGGLPGGGKWGGEWGCRGLPRAAAGCPDEENPAHGGARKTPGVSTRGQEETPRISPWGLRRGLPRCGLPRCGLPRCGLVRRIRELLESNKFYPGLGIHGSLDSNR